MRLYGFEAEWYQRVLTIRHPDHYVDAQGFILCRFSWHPGHLCCQLGLELPLLALQTICLCLCRRLSSPFCLVGLLLRPLGRLFLLPVEQMSKEDRIVKSQGGQIFMMSNKQFFINYDLPVSSQGL